MFFHDLISFMDNQAALGGGGLFCSKCNMKSLRQTNFARNNASSGGGGAIQFAPTDMASVINTAVDVSSAVQAFNVAGVCFYDNAAMFASSIVSSILICHFF